MMPFLFYYEMLKTEICDWKLMRIICDVQSVRALIRLRQCSSNSVWHKLMGGGSCISDVSPEEKTVGLITAFFVPT
jgi:hypothetical protein